MRLLFGREFPFDATMSMWDLLFAQEDLLQTADFTCVVMILRIRWQCELRDGVDIDVPSLTRSAKVIESDYNAALTLLLRYPPLKTAYAPAMLVRDAAFLDNNISTDAGRRIIEKYTKRTPIVGESVTGTSTRERFWKTHSRQSSRDVSPAPARTSGEVFGGLDALLQDAAKNVIQRGKKLEVNKTVREAFGEMRRNVRSLGSQRANLSREESFQSSRSSFTDDTGPFVQKVPVQRTRALAKMLEAAMEDLWSHQKEFASTKSSEDPGLKLFTAALAKVQLVQVYLEDSNLVLPEEEIQATNSSTQTSRTNLSHTSVERDSLRTSVGMSSFQTPGEQPSQRQTVSGRPSLEQSPYSWMLGQDETGARNLRSTSNTTKKTTEDIVQTPSHNPARANMAFLFGDAQDRTSGES